MRMDADFMWSIVRKLFANIQYDMFSAKNALGMRDAFSLLKELRRVEDAISEIRDELEGEQ